MTICAACGRMEINMRYFKEIKLWKIISLNIIIGLLLSGPFLVGLVLLFGLFRKPSLIEQMQGLGISIGILFAIFILNFLLWQFGKEKGITVDNKQVSGKKFFMKIIITIVALLITIGSFFIPGMNRLWLKLNGWWF